MTWIAPAARPERDRLVASIKRLAAHHGATTYAPHVTLVPNIESDEAGAEEALASAVTATTPIDLTFASVGHEQTYFRALYLVPQPSERLVALHHVIRHLWSFGPMQFQPHLSLLYSDVGEQHKGPLIDETGAWLPLTVRFDAIELWAATARVSDWHRVARVPLTE
jgi:2'-5' RNA ligase